MNIYVETNFVLELVFEQEQVQGCLDILELCVEGRARLLIPAYCLAEPLEKLRRQAQSRLALRESLKREWRQLTRTASYRETGEGIQSVESLLFRSIEDEKQRFLWYRDKVLTIAEIIPLTEAILKRAVICEKDYGFEPQDAIVFASVGAHLATYPPQASCFLNRNKKDFGSLGFRVVRARH